MSREQFAPEAGQGEVVEAGGGTDDRETLAASVGLGRPQIRGALMVVAAAGFFRATYPRELGDEKVGDSHLADWAGELANQLLGRVKNRLCQRGLDFSIG